MTAAVWEDERVVRGMGVHLQAQRDKGGARIGWKMGLGLPAALERLGTTGALVAELRDLTLLESGASLSVDAGSRWSRWSLWMASSLISPVLLDGVGLGRQACRCQRARLSVTRPCRQRQRPADLPKCDARH